jgi:hypothetical protein
VSWWKWFLLIMGATPPGEDGDGNTLAPRGGGAGAPQTGWGSRPLGPANAERTSAPRGRADATTADGTTKE